MSRKPTEVELRKETISFRITRSLYHKLVNRVNASDEANISDYARNALTDRMNKEGQSEESKSS